MTACRARHLPPDNPLHSSTPAPSVLPPSPTDLPAHDPASSLLLHSSPPLEFRPKSTPPSDRFLNVHPVYPSPPLTDAALASTVPLPDVYADPPILREKVFYREDYVPQNMSHDAAQLITLPSPPPTVPVTPKELPYGDEEDDEGHSVETWTYEESRSDGGVPAPLFPPVRDDSGFEEFVPSRGRDDVHKHERYCGDSPLLEPTPLWASPQCMDDEGLPPVGLPPFPQLSPMFDRSFGDTDSLISPISPSDTDSPFGRWETQSDMDWSPIPTVVDTLASPLPKDLGSSLGFQLSFPLPYHAQSPTFPQYASFPGVRPWYPQDLYGITGYDPVSPTPLAEDHRLFLNFDKSPISSEPADLDSEYADSIMPSDDDSVMLPPPSPGRRPSNDLYEDMPPYGGPCVTPVPESPHCSSLSLPDLDEAPSSPHSPHTALPELDGLFAEPSAPTLETISPSLLGGAPDLEDSLRLDMQPLSDPAFVRSPSPGDEDDFGFLDVQFDADATPAEAEEFCRLRSIRKTAQAQERAARAAEAELGERIQTVATSLLPPTRTEAPLNSSPPPTDPDCMQTDEPPPDTPGPSACFSTAPDVRARKRELQVLTEKRADARRARKAAKHRGKEVGALLELKTHTSAAAFAFLPVAGLPPPGAKGWTRSLAHLIAHMIFRRRERARPLENRLGALCADGSRPPLVRRPSRLGLVRDACAPGELEDEGGRAEDDGMVM